MTYSIHIVRPVQENPMNQHTRNWTPHPAGLANRRQTVKNMD